MREFGESFQIHAGCKMILHVSDITMDRVVNSSIPSRTHYSRRGGLAQKLLERDADILRRTHRMPAWREPGTAHIECVERAQCQFCHLYPPPALPASPSGLIMR